MMPASSSSPSESQVLLLRAAFLDGEQAIAAWDHWSRTVDVERLDPAVNRYLPQLYRHLSSMGVEHPLLERLKGVYRYTWSANAITVNLLRPALETFARTGIPCAVLDAAALVTLYYRDQGACLIDPPAVLVRPGDVAAAVRRLGGLGWTLLQPLPREPHLALVSSAGFATPGRGLHLHWRVLPECCSGAATEEALAAAGPVEIGGWTALALSPGDELLRAGVRAAQVSAGVPLRSYADVLAILRATGSALDWDRVIAQAARHRVVLPLLASLRWLRETLEAPIAADVVQRLALIPIAASDRLEHRLSSRPIPLLGRLPNLAFHYRRLSAGKPRDARIPGFAGYLRSNWGLDHSWQLPLYALQQGVRRVRSLV